MAIGKRLRFEILKRDGFRCHYCGVTACGAALEVDHVLPKSKGGTDDPGNLITACVNCNRGKSNIQLDELALEPPTPAKALEHAEQIREYLSACAEVQHAKNEVLHYLLERWWQRVDPAHCPAALEASFPNLAERYPLTWLVKAIEAVGNRAAQIYMSDTNLTKYFYGCLRRMKEGPTH